jgi:hypothetical protein
MVDNLRSSSIEFRSDFETAATASLCISGELTPICNIVTPVGMLGYGLYEDQTADALKDKLRNGAPTALILDSGSTDSGPEKLALGCMTVPRANYARDLRRLLELVWIFRVPLIFSSAGGDGSDEHVREMTEVVEEISMDAYFNLNDAMLMAQY